MGFVGDVEESLARARGFYSFRIIICRQHAEWIRPLQ